MLGKGVKKLLKDRKLEFHNCNSHSVARYINRNIIPIFICRSFEIAPIKQID